MTKQIKQYTILCIETGDYLYSIFGESIYAPFSKEEIVSTEYSIRRIPMKFKTRQEAFKFLKACSIAIKISSTVIIPCQNLELFDVVEYPVNG